MLDAQRLDQIRPDTPRLAGAAWPGRAGAELPALIQGGMGVAISSWRLARAVAREGAFGVVSGTALDVVYARRLQDGDPGGHVRWALAQFPVPRIAERVLASYYIEGGKPAQRPYRNVPMFTLQPPAALQELTVAANFCEVLLAKQGHGGPVGINYLRKIELPLPFACLGAMLAGVDYVLVGAGNPAEIPALLTRLARHDDVVLSRRGAQGATSADADISVRCSPRQLLGAGLPPLRRPRFVAIVASDEPGRRPGRQSRDPPGRLRRGGPQRRRAQRAAARAASRRRARTARLRPRDQVDLAVVAGLGLPFWLAGAYGTPQGLRRREVGRGGRRAGRDRVRVRAESGLADPLKRQVLAQVLPATCRSSPTGASPTGFPFKVVQAAGTLSDDEVFAPRQPVCDLGALRTPYRKPDGSIGYRCPAEPSRSTCARAAVADTQGRRCLCNALLATVGLAQHREDGVAEPALVTLGQNLDFLPHLVATAGDDFGAADVVARLLRS